MQDYIPLLSRLGVDCFWIIHEWFDTFTADEMVFGKPKRYYFENNPDVWKLPKKIIYVSKKSVENLNHIKKCPTQTIYNGLCQKKLAQLRDEHLPEKFMKAKGKIRIAIIGTVCQRKNQKEFIDNVFMPLYKKHQNIELLLVGGYLNDATGKFVQENKDSFILKTDNVKNAIPYMNSSDIIVSYSKNEVFPLNILESMFCGKPVLATDVGGCSEMITHGHDGFLVDLHDNKRAIEYLDKLICDQEFTKMVGQNARNTFMEKFEINKVFPNYVQLIRECPTGGMSSRGGPKKS